MHLHPLCMGVHTLPPPHPPPGQSHTLHSALYEIVSLGFRLGWQYACWLNYTAGWPWREPLWLVWEDTRHCVFHQTLASSQSKPLNPECNTRILMPLYMNFWKSYYHKLRNKYSQNSSVSTNNCSSAPGPTSLRAWTRISYFVFGVKL